MSEDHVSELLERLTTDAEFRAAYRRDPAAACRQCGMTVLGHPPTTPVHFERVLEGRESRSALAGLLVAGLIDVADHVQLFADAPSHLTQPEPSGFGAAGAAIPRRCHSRRAHGSPGRRRRGPGARIDLRHPVSGGTTHLSERSRWMADQAERHGLPRELPVMAALVESGLRNLDHGDAASLAYFQMHKTNWLEHYPGYPDKPELQMQGSSTRRSRCERNTRSSPTILSDGASRSPTSNSRSRRCADGMPSVSTTRVRSCAAPTPPHTTTH